MAKAPTKHGRDQALGFLNDLQDWELSFKDKKSKPHQSLVGKSVGLVNEKRQSVAGSASSYSSDSHPSVHYDPLSNIASTFMAEGGTVDATSEKELGNEYFKKKKFNEAIDCYSRSIALSPAAVTYANRAMAYLKIKRLKEAEEDCTEALNLDDRYIKAYARRATARKELGTLGDALADVEFALKLEPLNEELKKQRAEVKSLLEKAILARAAGTGTVKRPTQGVKEVTKNIDANGREKSAHAMSDRREKALVDVLPDKTKASGTKLSIFGGTENKNNTSDSKYMPQSNDSPQAKTVSSHLKTNKSKKELGTSVQELASRAASLAVAEAAKNLTAPNSAYQFEFTWRGFSGDRSLQTRLLKVTPPDQLPQIFKNALTAPFLVDIIKCIATIFTEETELGVKYLENLIKVPRFDMTIMCLSSADKADIGKIWKDVFLGNATPIEHAEKLSELRPKYCPR